MTLSRLKSARYSTTPTLSQQGGHVFASSLLIQILCQDRRLVRHAKKETKSLMAHLIVNIEPELIENFDRPAFSNLGDAA